MHPILDKLNDYFANSEVLCRKDYEGLKGDGVDMVEYAKNKSVLLVNLGKLKPIRCSYSSKYIKVVVDILPLSVYMSFKFSKYKDAKRFSLSAVSYTPDEILEVLDEVEKHLKRKGERKWLKKATYQIYLRSLI